MSWRAIIIIVSFIRIRSLSRTINHPKKAQVNSGEPPRTLSCRFRTVSLNIRPHLDAPGSYFRIFELHVNHVNHIQNPHCKPHNANPIMWFAIAVEGVELFADFLLEPANDNICNPNRFFMSLYGSILSICQSGCGFGNSLCTDQLQKTLHQALHQRVNHFVHSDCSENISKLWTPKQISSTDARGWMTVISSRSLSSIPNGSEWFTVRSLYSLIPLLIPLLPNSLYQVVPLYSDRVIARSPSCTDHKLMLPWRWQMHLAHGCPEMP